MTSLSPRIYPSPWHTHSTLGGWFGPALKYAGFDAVVISGSVARAGLPRDHVDGAARLVPAGDLWGQDARETQLALKARLGADAQVLAIGPAGENLVRFATVQHAEENAAGAQRLRRRLGQQAPEGDRRARDAARSRSPTRTAARRGAAARQVQHHAHRHRRRRGRPRPSTPPDLQPGLHVQLLRRTATSGSPMAGACPASASAAALAHREPHRRDRVQGAAVSRAAGAELRHRRGDRPSHELCNDLGLDLWFRLVMQPWLIRARELGIDAIRGYRIAPAARPGSSASCTRSPGARASARCSPRPAPRDGRAGGRAAGRADPPRAARSSSAFGFPAHREGPLLGRGAAAVLGHLGDDVRQREPRPDDRHAPERAVCTTQLRRRTSRRAGSSAKLSAEAWGYADAFEPTFEHKAPIAIWTQHQHMLIDSLPLCDFAFPQLLRPLAPARTGRRRGQRRGDLDLGRRLLGAVTGVDCTARSDLDRVAERAFTLERVMLARAGRDRAVDESLAPHFKLPCRVDGTSLDEAGFGRMLDEYYAARGWDRERG